jgi:hypothetical protein
VAASFATPAVGQPQPLGGRPIDAAQVLTAIERGVGYLRREQGPRGNWTELSAWQGGVTALCTLALLNAGVEPDDPAIQRALDYLRSVNVNETYTVALHTMVLCAAAPKKELITIQKHVEWLEAAQHRDGDKPGAWSYKATGGGGDNSNTQFAVLALYEAQLVGAKVNPQTWRRALDYWSRSQNLDGSWGYFPGDAGYGSMTCAGIAALIACSSAIEEGDAQVNTGRIVCCGRQERDDALAKALDWLARNFTVRHNPDPQGGGQPALYYYLYGLERAGRLSARRFIGEHDWYREGAEFLVGQQDRFGHNWTGTWNVEAKPHISTPMALLFLAKGRRPVVMAKLHHGPGDDWNQHQKDAANLTAYTEQAWELPLSWQIYDAESATVEDLLQAPVLYISGSQTPELLPHAQKIRDYVDRGGFLFAEACCRENQAFDAGFRRLIDAVFPEPEYRLNQVTPGHPLWRMEELVRADSPYVGRLWAVEYGCRTCVVYSEEDLSCYWELARPGRWREYPQPVIERIQDGLSVGINVLTYATGREPKGKEQGFDTPLVDELDDAHGGRDTIEIVKLRHGGGCNDAPGALVNLLRAAGQGELKLRIRTEPRMINISDDNLFRYHLAFMHGRHDFRLTPAERDRLRTYLERGGTLLVDAICASKPFAQAFRREMQQVMPTESLRAIPADDPLFTAEFDGYDIRQVSLRDPRDTGDDQPLANRVRQVAPQLEGVQLDGRWAVIFSPYDISCALEKHESVECRGYTREDAARIGLNVLMYSLNQ